MCRIGSSSARRRIVIPVASSPSSLRLSSARAALTSATPPPGTMPSSIAARVACSASSTRCFFSFISVSVAAPTLTTATPPESLARRSCSFSRSKSESVFSISVLIWLMRPLMASPSPAPSTIVVVSFATTMRRARPSCESWVFSSLRPISSVMTSPPVRIAMSSSMRLRRSPEPRALPGAAGLDDLLEHREQVPDRADLLVGDEDVRILQDRLHPLLVGDHVRRDVALVELHALGELEVHAERLALLDVHDAVLADLLDR